MIMISHYPENVKFNSPNRLMIPVTRVEGKSLAEPSLQLNSMNCLKTILIQ